MNMIEIRIILPATSCTASFSIFRDLPPCIPHQSGHASCFRNVLYAQMPKLGSPFIRVHFVLDSHGKILPALQTTDHLLRHLTRTVVGLSNVVADEVEPHGFADHYNDKDQRLGYIFIVSVDLWGRR